MKSAFIANLLYLPLLLVYLCPTRAAEGPEQSPGISWTPPGVVLEGVIVSSNPESSVALVRRQGAQRGRSVQVGKTIYGMTLIEVSEEAALFDLGGRQVWLFLDGSAVVPSPAIASLSGPAGDAPLDGINDTGTEDEGDGPEEKWIVRTLDHEMLEAKLDNEIEAILARTSVVLSAEDGASHGLAIQHLAEDTLLAELGLLAGDVLISINETSVDSLKTLTGLYPTFRSEEEIRVVADRRGQIVRIVVNINQGQ